MISSEDNISSYLMNLLDSLENEIVILDDRSRIIFANKSWKDFAPDSGKSMQKTSYAVNYLSVCDAADGKHSEGASTAGEGIRRVLSGEVDSFTHEYPCPDGDGVIQWYEMQVTKMKDQEPIQLVVTHKLITRRKKYEFALNNTNQNLEKKVALRTKELSSAIETLRDEVLRRRETEGQLKESQQQIRDFSRQLNNSIERERKEIAREIHDELGQTLTALKLDIAWLKRHSNSEDNDILQRFDGSISLVQATIATVKDILSRLRPSLLEEMGLVPAVEWQIRSAAQRSGINYNFSSDIDSISFSEEASLIIYRLAQEALNNILKHSQAEQMDFSFSLDSGKLVINISDDGTGFSQPEAGKRNSFGLTGIRERVSMLDGDFSIESQPGDGTRLNIIFDLKKVEAKHEEDSHS
jgi:signal transduction histidine kinase